MNIIPTEEMKAMVHFINQQHSKLNFAKPLIATCFLLCAVCDVSAGEENCTYGNSRYEFSIDASCDYFDRFDVIFEADNGDGILLRSEAEGFEIRVYGSLVRKADNEFVEIEEIIEIDPALNEIGIEQSFADNTTENTMTLTLVGRNHVTIYAEARSEKMLLAELNRELVFVVRRIRLK